MTHNLAIRGRSGTPARRTLTLSGCGLAMILVTLGAPCPLRADQFAPPLAPAQDAEATEWVERTLSGLDLRERVAQLVSVWMLGGYAARSSEEQVRLFELVEEVGIGGITISLGLPDSYVARLNDLQARAELPLLVSSDMESGPGYRLSGIYALPTMLSMGGATEFPPAMGFGAAGDPHLAFELGRVTGREARALGVHLNFAPVLDVNSNAQNPIINTRSFGEDPHQVALLGAAVIRGAREAGLMTTAKHFPGHGDTQTDSHIELPAIGADRAQLDSLELVPFRRAIHERVDAIMTAHVTAPAILGPDAPPATLDPFFMTRLLREELGFEGLLITDALDMGAIIGAYGKGEASIRALLAGADILLMPSEPELAIDSVVAAVAAGRLTEERIEASVRRVLTAKARADLHRTRAVDADRVPDIVGSEPHRAIADTAAARSITLVRDAADRVPLDLASRPRILSVTFARTMNLAAGRTFEAGLVDSGLDLRSARTDFATPNVVFDSLLGVADSVDLVILSAYVPPRSGEGSVDLPETAVRFAGQLARRGRTPILVSFGSPYLLSDVPDVETYLLAWGGGEVSQRAAAQALLGAAITGRLPISLPPHHALGEGLQRPESRPAQETAPVTPGPEADPAEAGMDADRLLRVDETILAAIADSVTPGAALVVGRRGQIVRLRGYGRLDYAPASEPVTDATLYDLASLTKVIGTTTAVMLLVDEGSVDLDAPVGDYLPEWAEGWKAAVTVRQLLLHRAGLPPFRPFWQEIEGEEAYRRAIAELPAEYPPGSRTVYSDIGFITLGLMVHQVSGQTLDRFLATRVFAPLEMRDTRFRPGPDRVAPTEVDTDYRQRHLQGEVHDENAYAMGGVAGHAGLFSSARDLAVFGGLLAGGGEGRPRGGGASVRLIQPSTFDEFTTRHDPSASRALGWDTPSGRSSAGRYMGPGAFGHTGFTGTSVWVDRDRDLFVVLLTNRVNPTRAQQGHIALRRAVHDRVVEAIADAGPPVPRGGTSGATAVTGRARAHARSGSR